MRALRWAGAAEAISYVLLVAVAMPLKYAYASPGAVRYLGMAHGLLFVAYLVIAVLAARAGRWPRTKLAAAIVASMIPFGPFVVHEALLDERWRRE